MGGLLKILKSLGSMTIQDSKGNYITWGWDYVDGKAVIKTKTSKRKNKKQMNIYLLSQSENNGYDTYDSCVVIAESENEARNTNPSNFVTHIKDGQWMGTYTKGGEYIINAHDWVSYSDIHLISVTLVGFANKEAKKGVVCASYNAG